MVFTYPNIDLSKIKQEVLLLKEVSKSYTNRYDAIFDCQSFSVVVKSFLCALNGISKSNFDVYVKNIQGYIQTEDNNSPICFDKALKRDLKPTAKYSFVYGIDMKDTKLYFQDDVVSIGNGDLIVFKTEQFIEDKSTKTNRIALIGSLTDELTPSNNNTLI